MYLKSFHIALLYILCILITLEKTNANKQKTAVIDDISEIKDFKQLLRTKTNVLVCFISKSSPNNANTIKSFKEAAAIIKGHGTMVLVDCTGAAKKMCRKLKVDQAKSLSLKHYKDGEFNKDYDRRETTSSIVNFMRDPTGSLPWDEDSTATDVIHLPNVESINRFLKKGPTLMKPSMIMFYAPWCGYCKVLKPEYANAATDLKGEAYMAAIDVAKPENAVIRKLYNITGFPTMFYYENGQMKYQYEGDSTRAALVEFMRFPRPNQKRTTKEAPEEDWSLTESKVVHLTSTNFDKTLSEKMVLVLFYAPWCGHCKRIKPEYEKAAAALSETDSSKVLAALDATKEPDIAARYGVKGYPTLKYFVNGEYKFDAHAREESKLIEFMKNPKAPPPAEPQWADEVTNVVHLQQENFKSVLKKKKHALIMFYAPWCGHCKKTKPEFVNAAEILKDDSRTVLGAVDCTKEQSLCKEYDVSGYPTFKYFSYFDKVVTRYSGGRTESEFVSFLRNPTTQPKENESDDSMELNDSNFDTAVDSSLPTLVMFYAPWCGYCKKMKPAFAAAAEKLASDNYPAKLAALDCTVNPKTAELYSVESYPTLKLFMKGKVIEDYDGSREKEDLVRYLKRFKPDSKEEL